MYNQCIICYSEQSNWHVSKCNHTWCTSCHHKMNQYKITCCPVCRSNITYNTIRKKIYKPLPKIRWRVKRHPNKFRMFEYNHFELSDIF